MFIYSIFWVCFHSADHSRRFRIKKKITIQDTILIILIDNVNVKMSRLGKISKTNLDISFSRKAGKNTDTFTHSYTLIRFHSHTTCSDEVPACWTSLTLDSLLGLQVSSTAQHVVSEKLKTNQTDRWVPQIRN